MGGNAELDVQTVLRYALFAYSLPPGHFFQSKIEGLEETPASTWSCPRRTSRRRSRSSRTPTSSRRRRRRGRAEREAEASATKAPPPRETTITVLNGNGVTGSAATASYLLSQRGYQMIYPPDGKPANAPNWDYFQTQDLLRQGAAGRGGGAKKVATLFGTEDVVPLTPRSRALSNGAMLTVIVGQTFHGTLAAAPVDKTPKRQPPNVAPGAEASLASCASAQRRCRSG